MLLSMYLQANGLTQGDAARLVGCDKSQITKICSQSYPNWEQKTEEYIQILRDSGYTQSISDVFRVNSDVVIPTRSVAEFNALADDLLDPEGSLSSSLGMVIGKAERGKTHTGESYVRKNPDACRVLYVEGTTMVQMLRDICSALANTRPVTFGDCLSVIEESCKLRRRLVIIDEADKCPVSMLELMRGVNERCAVPFIFVGEEGLKTKIERIPRLLSRIRKPIVLFDIIGPVDVSAFYMSACGVELDRALAQTLTSRARGAFRSVVNDALALAKMARASGIKTVTPEMVSNL